MTIVDKVGNEVRLRISLKDGTYSTGFTVGHPRFNVSVCHRTHVSKQNKT